MTKFQRPIFLLIIVLATVAANAQEQPARTWAGGGLSFTAATPDGGKAITGGYVETAYDLRHRFQVRGLGEYRREAAIRNLFTARVAPVEAESEIRYGAALIYHFRDEGQIRPMIGGGVTTIRHFFRLTGQTVHNYGNRALYNSSVNPTVIVGAGLGKSSEVVFTKYLADTYSYSNLRGYGFDVSHTRRIAGHLHLRTGVRARRWTYREGAETYDERSGEVSVFAGFRFQ